MSFTTKICSMTTTNPSLVTWEPVHNRQKQAIQRHGKVWVVKASVQDRFMIVPANGGDDIRWIDKSQVREYIEPSI